MDAPLCGNPTNVNNAQRSERSLSAIRRAAILSDRDHRIAVLRSADAKGI